MIGSDRLVLLNRTDITTSTNNVSVTNVFNAEYDQDKIVVANLTSVDTSASQVSLRFHDGSSTITASIITMEDLDYTTIKVLTLVSVLVQTKYNSFLVKLN